MGPHNTTDGAQTLLKVDKPMEELTIDPPFIWNEFTISFFWKTDGNATNGILYMDNVNDGCKSPVSINSRGKDLAFFYGDETGCHVASRSNSIIGILQPNEFTFMTMVYRGKSLKFYDENGLFRGGFHATIQLATVKEIILGFGTTFHSNVLTKPQTNALSCLVVYKTALRPEDFTKIPSACRQLIST